MDLVDALRQFRPPCTVMELTGKSIKGVPAAALALPSPAATFSANNRDAVLLMQEKRRQDGRRSMGWRGGCLLSANSPAFVAKALLFRLTTSRRATKPLLPLQMMKQPRK